MSAEGEQPLVSVVIASVNGLPAITECLEHLMREGAKDDLEVVVVDRCGETVRSAIRERFDPSAVRLLESPADTSIPRLRAMGMREARGEMLVILEDHCNVAPGWLAALRRAHEAGYTAIGGAVENGSVDRLTDWAVFFCEYARFMPPLRRGVVEEITGNNSAYGRALLERLGAAGYDEVWESFLHARIRELGEPFYCEPDMLVYHKKEFGFGYFVSQRYHYSRSFAGMRLAEAPRWKCVAYAAATPLLVPLIGTRIARTVYGKRRGRGRFVLCTPLLFVFLVVWAWGEAIGALAGPGDSLRKVE